MKGELNCNICYNSIDQKRDQKSGDLPKFRSTKIEAHVLYALNSQTMAENLFEFQTEMQKHINQRLSFVAAIALVIALNNH